MDDGYCALLHLAVRTIQEVGFNMGLFKLSSAHYARSLFAR